MVWDILGVSGFVIACLALWIVASTVRQLGQRDPAALPPLVRQALRIRSFDADPVADFSHSRPGRDRIAFIANPTKPGVSQAREIAYRACATRYLPEPLWFYTTRTDSGAVAAQEALDSGATVLVVLGGDGTVRAVSEVAAQADAPIGIVPLGTGNLLARNLGIPLNDTPAAVRTALDTHESAVDMGIIDITDERGQRSRHPFLIFAGVGIDADMVAGTSAGLKARLGWGAYFWAAVPFMRKTRIVAHVSVDEEPAVRSKMRTILAANAGRLPGGMVLVSDASLDDGALDFAVIDARAGIAGWAELFGEVIAKGAGLATPSLPQGWRAGRIDHKRGSTAEVMLEVPQRVQADGESLGRAVRVGMSLAPAALRVRHPRPARKKRTNRS